jgi:hypothetical protein
MIKKKGRLYTNQYILAEGPATKFGISMHTKSTHRKLSRDLLLREGTAWERSTIGNSTKIDRLRKPNHGNHGVPPLPSTYVKV